MLIAILRVVIILLVLLFVMRIMGKKTMGEMQPFEFVITLAIAELACVPMSDTAIPILYGIVPIVVVCVLHFVFSVLCRKSTRLRKFFNGSSVVVISPNGVEPNALKKLNISADDLIDACAAQGYFSLDAIHTAYFTTNGKLTVIPRTHAAPPTLGDLRLDAEQASYPLSIVEDGRFVNLDAVGLDEAGARRALRACGVDDVSSIAVATADRNGNVYVKQCGKPFATHVIDALVRKEVCYE